MSRRYFYTRYKNRPIEIVFGYDTSELGNGYFLDIEFIDRNNEDEDFLYNSLDDLRINFPHPDLNYFTKKLQNYGIVIPKTMIYDLEKDHELVLNNQKDQVINIEKYYTLY